MLEGITWGYFAVIIAGALLLYFIVLLATGQLKIKPPARSGPAESTPKRFWQVEQRPPAGVQQVPEMNGMAVAEEGDADEERAASDRTFAALESLAVALQDICTEAGVNASKANLSAQLREQIAAYPALNQPAFKGAITNLIVKAAQVDCNIEFTMAEAEALWS
ncbi:hypothetical protein [Chitinophaga filiformis]|uniref:Uncharacterized protein n=1 Tax=Chitinophaga filiformis TaxID=104663 RepID=A0ABY4HY18_CHIFI|nr:hypothetical protein [Chitinophaga filiformis]UPK68034.1 hypothetical protein MYF79_24075 [Chitinophaga filiformis]